MDKQHILEELNEKLMTVKDSKSLNEIRIDYIGKKGLVAELMKGMKNVEDKRAYGQQVNDIKEEIISKIGSIEKEILEKEKLERLKVDEVDVTIPVYSDNVGKQNILLKTKREIEDIFLMQGYELFTGPEIETDFHNFDALNLPKNHPARDMQDTFYISEELLLRTHTSNSQSRTLSANINKEMKIICPGKVYRRDDDDATHSHQFMQIEGLVVVKKENSEVASLKNLKTTLEIFAKRIFENEKLKVRMRNSYFPFTEPSFEVDITCIHCLGKGCKICKNTGWIEVLGSGITHQNVLQKAGYNPDEYSAFAFGIGVERIAMLKYGIDDIRHFYVNDTRFIKQF